MFKKTNKVNIKTQLYKKEDVVEIVSDAAIASHDSGEGKFFIVLILDTSKRSDIEELVRVHQHLQPGDVICQWAKSIKSDSVILLILKFIRPFELMFIIEFNIDHQGVLVDQILSSGAVYIQPGRLGDNLSGTMDNPKILVEIPKTGFEDTWLDIFQRHVTKDFMRRGLRKKEAKQAAIQCIEEMRKLGKFRMSE